MRNGVDGKVRPGESAVASCAGGGKAATTKARIVHMVEAFDRIGGPPKLVRSIIGSVLREKYEFEVLSYAIAGLSPRAIVGLVRQLRRCSPDIVHIHGLKTDGIHAAVAAKLAGASRVVVTIHGSTADAVGEYRAPHMKLRRWVVGYILEPITLRLSTAVYCVCDATKAKRRIRLAAGRRLRDTIHNGIDPMPVVSRNDGLRKELGFSSDDVVLIYAGRIVGDKGLEVLAGAMIEAVYPESASKAERHAAEMSDAGASAASGSRLRLTLVGDGAEFDRIRSKFEPLVRSKHVVMTGRRDDMDDLFAMADILVFPSFHENLPFVLLEAMSAGLPVIATAVGGNPEVVEDGVTGRLVPPRDASALAGAIVELASDSTLRRRMGLAGRERVRRNFSLQAMIEKTDDVYRSLLAKGD